MTASILSVRMTKTLIPVMFFDRTKEHNGWHDANDINNERNRGSVVTIESERSDFEYAAAKLSTTELVDLIKLGGTQT